MTKLREIFKTQPTQKERINISETRNILDQWQREIKTIKQSLGLSNEPENNEKPPKTTGELIITINTKLAGLYAELASYDEKIKKQSPGSQEYDLENFKKSNVLKLIEYYEKTINKIKYCIKEDPRNEKLAELSKYIRATKQKNFASMKAIKMATDLEKIEKNDLKRKLAINGEILEKPNAIEKFKQAIDFEIRFYNLKINEIDQLKTKIANTDEEKKKILLDRQQYNNIIAARKERKNKVVSTFNTLKQEGKIDDNFNILKDKRLSYADSTTIDIANKTITGFDNYSAEKMENKKHNEKVLKKYLQETGQAMASNNSDLIKQCLEFRYSLGKNHQKIKKLSKKIFEIKNKYKDLENLIRETGPNQTEKNEIQKQLTDLRNKLNRKEQELAILYQQNMTAENLKNIDTTKNDIKKIENKYLKIQTELAEMGKQSSPEIEKEKEKISNLIKKTEDNLQSMIEYNKQIDLAQKQAGELLKLKTDLFDLKKMIENLYFVDNDTLNRIKEFINPKVTNDSAIVSAKTKWDDKKTSKQKPTRNGNRGKGRGGNRGRR